MVYKNKKLTSEASCRYLSKTDFFERLRAITLLGGKCIRCGETDIRALNIDHIYGSGNTERAKFAHPYLFYRYVIAHLTKYQCYCANHNQIKKYEAREGISENHPLISGNYLLTYSL